MNWLKKQREKLGLNQEELLARLQVEGLKFTSPATISNWENDKHKLPLNDDEFRLTLAKVLRLSEKEILKLSGYDIGQQGHSDEAERAADIIDQLSPDQRSRVLRVVELFAETG